MKRLTLFLLVLTAAFIFPACLKTETATVVHPDGSITRTLIFTGDSTDIARHAFVLPLDSSWTTTTSWHDSSKAEFRAEKTFTTADAMNLAGRGERGKTITVVGILETHFRWIFTTYDYTEQWKCYRTVESVPLGEYVSLKDMDLLYEKDIQDSLKGGTTDSTVLNRIAGRFEEWTQRNVFESYFRVLRSGAASLASPRLTVEMLDAQRSHVFELIGEALGKNPNDPLKVIKLFSDALHNDMVTNAFSANRNGFDSLKALLDFDGSGMGKIEQTSISMPGVVIRTNAEQLDGATGTWKHAFGLQYLRDVELRMTSRVLNWWAVIITGIVVIGGAAYLTAAGRRKRTAGI